MIDWFSLNLSSSTDALSLKAYNRMYLFKSDVLLIASLIITFLGASVFLD